ncbi:MAG: ribonuclease P protein component [Dehalococcoidia bacterium]|nr:ribonuclease P protein component [Dehalococcoidia bacterium]
MGKKYRLTSKSDFSNVYNGGFSRANRLLVLKALPNSLSESRFGFSVSRRIGNAVVRNRVKRLLRECVRSQLVKGSWDIVFIARKPVLSATFQDIRQSVSILLKKSGIIEESEVIPSTINSSCIPRESVRVKSSPACLAVLV